MIQNKINHKTNYKINIIFKKYKILLFLYILLSFAVYLHVSDHLIEEGSFQSLDVFFQEISNEENIGLHLWADSSTYTVLSKEYALNDISLIMDLSPNYLGPFLILKVFGSNENLIYIFNVIIFLLSISILIKHYNLNEQRFVLLLCSSPMVFTSLLSINKEVLTIFSLSMFLAYIKKRKLMYVVICLISAVLARWQFIFIMILLLMSFSKYNYFKNNRYVIILLSLAVISLLYPILTQNIFEHYNAVALDGAIEWEGKGSGLFPFWINMQNNFLYFIIFIPKTLHLLVGTISQFSITKIINRIDFYNSFVVVSQSLVFMFLLVQMTLKKKININNDVFYIALIMCIFISMTPIFAPRYLFPLHLLFALTLSMRKNLRKYETPNMIQGIQPLVNYHSSPMV